MKLDTLRRNTAALSRLAAALILCALPALAQEEDSAAAPAQQEGHYEVNQEDGQAETEEAPAPIQQPPTARPRIVPRVFRARPGGTREEPGVSTDASDPDATISGGGQSLGGQGMGPAPTAARSCAWTSEISPTPAPPTLPCSIENEGAVSPNSQNQGSFTCICESRAGPSPAPSPSPARPGSPAAQGDLCAAYGLPNTIEVPKAGNTSKYLYMPANGAYVFTFVTGAAGTSGMSLTQYSTVSQAMTISKYKCDFSPVFGRASSHSDLKRLNGSINSPNCGQAETEGRFLAPHINWRVIGGKPQPADVVMCLLEPNTKYYVNLMDAIQDPATRRFISTCPGGKCPFRFY